MLIMGNRAYPFVKKTILYCRTNPEFSPRYFDSTKLELDFTAFEQLSKLSKLMLPLTQLVIDTETICGNRAYKASLLYYSSVQEGAKRNIPDAKPILEDLSLHFKKTKRKTDSSNDTEGSENHDTTS